MKRGMVGAAILALAIARVWAQAPTPSVPELVNYQGKLTDLNGNPLASGNYTMEFNIYAVKTGGTPIWGPIIFDNGTATGHGAKVAVQTGHFNVYLGPVDVDNDPISVAFTQATRYLGIKVTTGTWSAGLPEISPRQQILSSPYALQAGDADSVGRGKARSGTGAFADQLVVPTRTSIGSGYASNAAPANGLIVQGNVGIGTNNPLNLLHVLGVSRLEGILATVSTSIGSGYFGTAPPTNGLIVQGNVGIGRTAPTQKLEVEGRIKDKTGFVMPVGVILPYAGPGAAPEGWLICSGAAVSRTTYADLFAIIGTTYGAGDNVNTFNLPNLKGRAPFGFDSAQGEFNALGKTGGEKSHTLTITEMPSHSHAWLRGNEQDDSGYGGSYNEFTQVGGRIDGVIENTGGGGAHNTLPPFLTLGFIIKY